MGRNHREFGAMSTTGFEFAQRPVTGYDELVRWAATVTLATVLWDANCASLGAVGSIYRGALRAKNPEPSATHLLTTSWWASPACSKGLVVGGAEALQGGEGRAGVLRGVSYHRGSAIVRRPVRRQRGVDRHRDRGLRHICPGRDTLLVDAGNRPQLALVSPPLPNAAG